MLVTFTTKTYPDITMFGDVATRLIKMMGASGTVPSAIDAAGVSNALARLRASLESELPAEASGSHEDADHKEPPVSLSRRAFPLIELLEAAAAAEDGVTWR
jgi:hypothetical protein